MPKQAENARSGPDARSLPEGNSRKRGRPPKPKADRPPVEPTPDQVLANADAAKAALDELDAQLAREREQRQAAPARPYDEALAFARRGFRVFPLERGAKRPTPGGEPIDGPWSKVATTDAGRIGRWFLDGRVSLNFGVVPPGGYCVIDVDSREAARRLKELEAEQGELPATWTARTPRGLHLYFRLPDACRDIAGTRQIDPAGVDIKANGGGYVVGPGSVRFVTDPAKAKRTARPYYWLPGLSPADIGEPAVLPAWLAEKARKSDAKVYTGRGGAVDIPSRRFPPTVRGMEKLAEARAIIREATNGDQNNALYKAGCKVGFAIGLTQIDAATAQAALLDEGRRMPNYRPRDPWGDDQIRTQVERGIAHGIAFARERFPEIAEVNDHWFMARIGGSTVVCRESFDAPPPAEPEAPPPPLFVPYKPQAFKDWYANRFVPRRGPDGEPDPSKPAKPLGAYWLAHAERRQYDSVALDPDPRGRGKPGVYNLWAGFAVEPRASKWERDARTGRSYPRSWRRYYDHLREHVCDGDDALLAYILDLFAWKIQHPGKRPGVAVFIRGPQGCGKNTTFKPLKLCFGRHFTAYSDRKKLFSQFNWDQADKLVIESDEAFFAGDHREVSDIKARITDPSLVFEEKFVSKVSLPNRQMFVGTSNEQRVVPAEPDDRRFVMIDMALPFPGDKERRKAYFNALHDELEDGGAVAFLADMLARDVSDFDPTLKPDTAALAEQKLQNLSTLEAWWLNCLESETTPGKDSGPFDGPVLAQRVLDDLWDFARQRRATDIPNSVQSLRSQLKKFLPEPGITDRPKTSKGAVWAFPPRAACRRYWIERTGIPFE